MPGLATPGRAWRVIARGRDRGVWFVNENSTGFGTNSVQVTARENDWRKNEGKCLCIYTQDFVYEMRVAAGASLNRRQRRKRRGTIRVRTRETKSERS